jgi:hypothetical protein
LGAKVAAGRRRQPSLKPSRMRSSRRNPRRQPGAAPDCRRDYIPKVYVPKIGSSNVVSPSSRRRPNCRPPSRHTHRRQEKMRPAG